MHLARVIARATRHECRLSSRGRTARATPTARHLTATPVRLYIHCALLVKVFEAECPYRKQISAWVSRGDSAGPGANP